MATPIMGSVFRAHWLLTPSDWQLLRECLDLSILQVQSLAIVAKSQRKPIAGRLLADVKRITELLKRLEDA